MSKRQRFKCQFCGLRIEGRKLPDGTINVYARGPTSQNIPEEPCVCVNCQQNAVPARPLDKVRP